MGAEPAEVWWSGGVRFSCLGCGRCCRGEPGAIFFTPDEGRRSAEFLQLDEVSFTRRYVTMKWGRPSFRERANGDCVFYRAEESKCALYQVRPAQCSLFPFWLSVMESREEWERQARHCPGMNSGRLHPAAEIAALLRRSPFGDL